METSMWEIDNIKILFVAGFGPIVGNGKASQALYMSAFGLPLLQKEDLSCRGTTSIP
jgi:hypothetical protein